MNKLFRPKCMRRMAVFMALVAPMIYLFGSLFTALVGAHGEIVLADGETSHVDMDNTYDGSSYTRHLYFDESASVTGLYPLDGVLYIGDEYYYYSGTSSITVNGLSASSSLDFVSYVSIYSAAANYQTVESGHVPSACFSLNLGNRVYIECFGNVLRFIDVVNGSSGSADNLLTFRSSYGSVSFTELFSENAYVDSFRLIPVRQPTVVVPASVNNSDYLFGQFFAKDNFLVQWGENAISENPYGFAPFGYFWRYLDVNVLHLSNDQAGLMAYGYMYYASHVLLFDVGFILVTFFLSFIQKVADKIGGEEHA